MAQQLLYWKLAIWKAVSGSLLVLLGGSGSLVLNWDTMTLGGRIVAASGLAVGVLKFLDGFLDQTASRLAAGKPLVPIPGINGGTEFVVKPKEEPSI